MQRAIPTKRFISALIVLTAGFSSAFFTYYAFFLISAVASMVVLEWEIYKAPITRTSFKLSRKNVMAIGILIVVIALLGKIFPRGSDNWAGDLLFQRLLLVLFWLGYLGVLTNKFFKSRRTQSGSMFNANLR